MIGGLGRYLPFEVDPVTAPAHAAELRARYAGQLVIERDAALDPSTDKP